MTEALSTRDGRCRADSDDLAAARNLERDKRTSHQRTRRQKNHPTAAVTGPPCALCIPHPDGTIRS